MPTSESLIRECLAPSLCRTEQYAPAHDASDRDQHDQPQPAIDWLQVAASITRAYAWLLVTRHGERRG